LRMKLMTNNKNRNSLFYFSLIVSLVLHFSLLYPRSREKDKEIKLPSKKAGLTFINFSIYDNGHGHLNHYSKVNKNDNSKSKKTGDLHTVKPGEKNSSSSSRSASLSKDPVKTIIKSYKSRILSRIQKMKYYPLTARRMNQEGVVFLKFILKKNGTLDGSVKLVKGCEHEMLNRAGVKTIYKSLPFPSFPDVYLNDNIEFNVQIVYNLKY
jgi:TonB family protein